MKEEFDVFQEENMYLEKKKSLLDEKDFLATVCAFANTEGGTIVIGVRGKEIIGVKKTDEIQRKIGDLIRNKISPKPSIKIKEMKIQKKKIILVYVFPVKGISTYRGKIFIRVGSSNRVITGNELLKFIEEKKLLSFEDQLAKGTISEIDEVKLNKFLETRGLPVNKNRYNALKSLNLTLNGGLKNLAFLLFAKDIKQFFPQCGIKIVKFKGTEPIEIAQHEIMWDTVPELITRSIDLVKVFLLKSIKIRGKFREEELLIPEFVIRELIVNAIGHRDYFDPNLVQISIFDDRMEVVNPGKPLVKIEDLGSIAIHRNPSLYLFLHYLGLSEGYGTGIARIKSIIKKLNLPLPKFEEADGFFKVTVYFEISKKEDLIYKIILLKGPIKSTELAKETGLSVVSVHKYLKILLKQGKIRKCGKGKLTVYKAR